VAGPLRGFRNQDDHLGRAFLDIVRQMETEGVVPFGLAVSLRARMGSKLMLLE
jgi:hypothetical protein